MYYYYYSYENDLIVQCENLKFYGKKNAFQRSEETGDEKKN